MPTNAKHQKSIYFRHGGRHSRTYHSARSSNTIAVPPSWGDKRSLPRVCGAAPAWALPASCSPVCAVNTCSQMAPSRKVPASEGGPSRPQGPWVAWMDIGIFKVGCGTAGKGRQCARWARLRAAAAPNEAAPDRLSKIHQAIADHPALPPARPPARRHDITSWRRLLPHL